MTGQLHLTYPLAALAALALFLLSFPVSLRRMKVGASLGDAGDEVLLRRIRAQGNFVEFAPLGLIVIALMEASGASAGVVWVAAGALVLGRLAHAVGMLANILPGRMIGMVLTYASLLTGAAVLARAAMG